MKRISEIYNVEIVKAETVFPFNLKLKGKFIALGNCGKDDRPGFDEGMPLRTSPIVNVDIEAGTIETLNTIYHIK